MNWSHSVYHKVNKLKDNNDNPIRIQQAFLIQKGYNCIYSCKKQNSEYKICMEKLNNKFIKQ